MAEMGAESVDAIVCDPPYGLAFMGKEWDHGVPGAAFWREALRVAKPGAHLLAFGGSRTYHRLACAVEDAGWDIRDQILWLYGTGFPKSLDVGKAIDKAAGAVRKVVGANPTYRDSQDAPSAYNLQRCKDLTAPSTDAAKRWHGFGTALKPAHEPIVLARKPLTGTVAANVCEHGTGALNIDGCRVGSDILPERVVGQSKLGTFERGVMVTPERVGRWPANIIFDEEAAAMLDEQTGGASRFFYCAKAGKKERGEGNVHPTVKPLALMRYLLRLVTPPRGLVLDPFAGSGTTVLAAVDEGFDCIGIEKEPEYAKIAAARLLAHQVDALLS
jgi:site-specific DNA-methyltransferase (adenine-specific)